MPSDAARAAKTRMSDVDRLLDIHVELKGAGPGRRYDVEVLNRAGIVFLTGIWEGYVESLSAEAVSHLVAHTSDPLKLPKSLLKEVAKELADDPNDLSVWKLAEDGWKALLTSRLSGYATKTASSFNTPNSQRIDTLFDKTVGLSRLSDHWHWRSMPTATASAKVNSMVVLRGDIAHGAGASRSVKKREVRAHKNHVTRLMEASDDCLNSHLLSITGTPLF